jgi:uncharacterized membrane protein
MRQNASRTPGWLLGMGLGGFVDGIVLHQILQWHNMGSARMPPVTLDAVRENMRWDGFFHAGAWLLTLSGVYLLLRHARSGARVPTTRMFSGQMLAGWGAFNLVEGIIDHHILALHHVRDLPAHVPVYDWMFLLFGGLGLLLVGGFLARERM